VVDEVAPGAVLCHSDLHLGFCFPQILFDLFLYFVEGYITPISSYSAYVLAAIFFYNAFDVLSVLLSFRP